MTTLSTFRPPRGSSHTSVDRPSQLYRRAGARNLLDSRPRRDSATHISIEGLRMFMEMVQALTGVFVVVYDGQHALKFTLGRATGVVGPGVNFKWPIIQRFRVVDTKDTTIDLEPQIIQLSDDLVYEVGAKAVYQIVDVRKALIEIDNLVVGLKNRLVLIVQRVVRGQTRQSVREMGQMIQAVKDELRPVEQQWGVQFHEFGFSTFSPSPETLEITQLR